jgi:hypothetical protein
MNTIFARNLAVAAMLSLAALVSGCADDSGNGSGGGLNPGGDGPIFPNNGTVPTNVTEDGTPISGNFICTKSAQASNGATTEVGANGLLGGPLTDLLNTLGGDSVTALTNSITDKDLTIDGTLETGSTWTLTAALLAGIIDSIDQSVILPNNASSGTYAVFGVSFPAGTLDLTLLNSLTVSTYNNDVLQESQSFSQAAIIDLLGMGVVGDRLGFFGIKTTKAWDRATIALSPTLLSANVGEAMKVHELCTGGKFVTP